MVPPLLGRALIAAWKAAVSSFTPLPMAPMFFTLMVVAPITGVGVALYQTAADAGRATAERARNAPAARYLRASFSLFSLLRLRRATVPVACEAFRVVSFSAVFKFTCDGLVFVKSGAKVRHFLVMMQPLKRAQTHIGANIRHLTK